MSAFNLVIVAHQLTHVPPASQNCIERSFNILMMQVPSLKTTLDSGTQDLYQNMSILLSFVL